MERGTVSWGLAGASTVSGGVRFEGSTIADEVISLLSTSPTHML